MFGGPDYRQQRSGRGRIKVKAVLFGKFEFKQSRYVEDRNMQNTFYGVDVRVYSTEIVARIGTGSDFFFF